MLESVECMFVHQVLEHMRIAYLVQGSPLLLTDIVTFVDQILSFSLHLVTVTITFQLIMIN